MTDFPLTYVRPLTPDQERVVALLEKHYEDAEGGGLVKFSTDDAIVLRIPSTLRLKVNEPKHAEA